jgi:2',3'-cyclic-nucleotide 2'-phosphodiesterase (5'-nucleotidase family)
VKGLLSFVLVASSVFGVATTTTGCDKKNNPISQLTGDKGKDTDGKKDDKKSKKRPDAGDQKLQVTVLATSDENGYIMSTSDTGVTTIPIASMFYQWIRDEDHCVPDERMQRPGREKPDHDRPRKPEKGAKAKHERCEPRTIAVSAGDHFLGSAVSSLNQGKPIADLMGDLNYEVSALGNNDFAFGRDAYLQLQKQAGFVTVAANAYAVSPEAGQVHVQPYTVIQRRWA